MALSREQADRTVKSLLRSREEEQPRFSRVARYYNGAHDSVYMPRGAQGEYRWLYDRSTVNLMRIVVAVMAQNLYVDGYRSFGEAQDEDAWHFWQLNQMDSRQHGLHRSVLKYGLAYSLVLPGVLRDERVPVITPVSPRRLTAFYADPLRDEWPLYALEVIPERVKAAGGALSTRYRVRLFDDEAVYPFYSSASDEETVNVERAGEPYVHGLGVCPVVRYVNEADLDEESTVSGEIEPLIPMQDQVNSTTMNLLMAQQFGAYRQRVITGWDSRDEKGRQKKLPSGVDRTWAFTDPDVKVTDFTETDLSGFLKSREETIRIMSTVSQTPPNYLLGQMANLSAEALVSARDGLDRKLDERKSTFGEAHEQMLRLCGLVAGDQVAWDNTEAQVIWRDTSTRALSQTVDALVKVAQGLEVPVEALWERLPWATQSDVIRYGKLRNEAEAFDNLDKIINGVSGQNAVSEAPEEGVVGGNDTNAG